MGIGVGVVVAGWAGCAVEVETGAGGSTAETAAGALPALPRAGLRAEIVRCELLDVLTGAWANIRTGPPNEMPEPEFMPELPPCEAGGRARAWPEAWACKTRTARRPAGANARPQKGPRDGPLWPEMFRACGQKSRPEA